MSCFLCSRNNGFDCAVQRQCSLEDILAEFCQLEFLDEYICRRCTLVETHARLKSSLEAMRNDEAPTSSRKKRTRALQREFDKVDQALVQDVERELPDVRLTKVLHPATKQTMIARVSAFH